MNEQDPATTAFDASRIADEAIAEFLQAAKAASEFQMENPTCEVIRE